MNAIGAIVNFIFLSVGLFNANIDSDIFYAWLTQELLPKVPEHPVLVMDNAAFHQREENIVAMTLTLYFGYICNMMIYSCLAISLNLVYRWLEK